MDDRWSVYIHTNKTNGKRYVGITSQIPENRWLGGHGYDGRLKFGRAIAKYGWDGFTHEVIHEGLSEVEAKNIECDLIRNYSTQDDRFGHNGLSGGDTAAIKPEATTKIDGQLPAHQQAVENRRHQQSKENLPP